MEDKKSMKIDTVLVDRYQIREQLSRKAGRQTFLAQDLRSQDLVIIKILQFDIDFHWDDLKLFEREAATLQHLDHPAIPKYLDYFEMEEKNAHGFALVQTYIEAPSLESVVKAGRKFSEAEVIELADRMLSILTYLHEQIPPVIHRDIKPSNILLTNRSGNSVGDLYLVDFGSVQTAASKDGGTITIVGSYGYMPLEQFGGQTTASSDLYSLGMTIIYLLTSTHPAELPQVNGQVKFTAEISSKFRRWLEKITQPHLEKRFDAAQSAQTSLKSEDGSYGDFMHLKPADSKLELYRDQDKLEIRFPIWTSAGCFYSALFLSGSLINITIFFVGLFSITTWGWGYVLMSGVLAITFWFLVPSYDNLEQIKVISIDHNLKKIRKGIQKVGHENVKWNKSQSCNLDFDTLVYSPSHTISGYIDVKGNHHEGILEIKPELYLNSLVKKYCINEAEILFLDSKTWVFFSEAELWWLGQELSDFLNLELQVIHSKPRLKPSDQ
jgi:serine/threonine protein kinase